jgi:hypothetical protein
MQTVEGFLLAHSIWTKIMLFGFPLFSKTKGLNYWWLAKATNTVIIAKNIKITNTGTCSILKWVLLQVGEAAATRG